MGPYNSSEKDYRVALQAALVIHAVQDVLDAMAGIAARLIERGMTEDAANILTYVTRHPDVRHDTFDATDEMYMDLEERECPRVMEDAAAFILGKSLNTMANYIADIPMPD